jgi:hypothetical protein
MTKEHRSQFGITNTEFPVQSYCGSSVASDIELIAPHMTVSGDERQARVYASK